MIDESPATSLVIRLATPADIAAIDELDSFSTSPPRDVHREIQNYFGSVDPSTHVQTLIFLAEINGSIAGKAELMLPPPETPNAVGYVKRVVVHPQFRKRGLARSLMQHIIDFARSKRHLAAIDLHVWENNLPAIRLYEDLGFALEHRELYYRLKL